MRKGRDKEATARDGIKRKEPGRDGIKRRSGLQRVLEAARLACCGSSCGDKKSLAVGEGEEEATQMPNMARVSIVWFRLWQQRKVAAGEMILLQMSPACRDAREILKVASSNPRTIPLLGI